MTQANTGETLRAMCQYNIICYILTGSSHTHISQLMVLKIARVSISNDVEMSPVSLYLVEGEIGALAAQ